MNTILLVTSDDGLRHRISDALGADVDVVRSNPACALPHALDSSAPLLVVDCRALQLVTEHSNAATEEHLKSGQAGGVSSVV